MKTHTHKCEHCGNTHECEMGEMSDKTEKQDEAGDFPDGGEERSSHMKSMMVKAAKTMHERKGKK